jgi:DNA primase small subunit
MSVCKYKDILKYYKSFFPFSEICEWTVRSSHEILLLREFSFANSSNIYKRNVKYSTPEFILDDFITFSAIRIDFGAIETTTSGRLRELIFDIDLTDYDDVRRCCSGTEICSTCWKFVSIGGEILENILRKSFGFKKINFVFSGRRGIHCFITDREVYTYTDSHRKSILNYIENILNNKIKSDYSNILKKYNVDNTYLPRFDKQVTISAKHLIKVPMSIHPATGNVCVFIKDLKTFNLSSVPNIRDIKSTVFIECVEDMREYINSL